MQIAKFGTPVIVTPFHTNWSDRSYGRVKGMVGFAEQSGLSRAARRWWDASAREVRIRHSAVDRRSPPRPSVPGRTPEGRVRRGNRMTTGAALQEP